MANLKEVIETVKTFTPQQLAVIVTLITSCFFVFFWVENRYANLKKTEENIERMLLNIIQIDSKVTATINRFSEEEIKKIEETASKQEKAIRSYVGK